MPVLGGPWNLKYCGNDIDAGEKEAGKVDPHSVGRNGSKGGVLIFIEQISNGVSQQEDNCVRKQYENHDPGRNFSDQGGDT